MSFMSVDEIKAILEQKLGIILDMSQDEFFNYINIPSGNFLSLMRILRDDIGLNYLANLTAVDYGEEFELVYHLYNIPDNGIKMSVKSRVPRPLAQLDSLCSLFPTADWQEREVFDLMGITFREHPNLGRILLPESFSGHPLCKDFSKEAGSL